MRRTRSVGVMLVVGLALALALVAYGSAAAVTKVAQTRVIASAAKKKETKAQKLAKALKACKNDNSKAKRKACEKKARKQYGAKKPSAAKPPSKTGTQATGTGTGTTTGTGTGTTTATGATTGTGATTATGATIGTGATTGTTTGAAKIIEELERAKRVSQMPTAGAIEQGRSLFAQDCSGCHGAKGEGQSGDDFVAYANLPRAQSVTGVIEQLIEPDGGMPTFEALPFEQKEELGDFVCVVLTAKCDEAH